MFDQYGTILSVSVHPPRGDGLCYGFVEYDSVRSAQDAVDAADGWDMGTGSGTSLQVRLRLARVPNGERPSGNARLPDRSDDADRSSARTPGLSDKNCTPLLPRERSRTPLSRSEIQSRRGTADRSPLLRTGNRERSPLPRGSDRSPIVRTRGRAAAERSPIPRTGGAGDSSGGSSSSIYVSKLPAGTREHDIGQMFDKFGTISSIKVFPPKQGNLAYGFVNFESLQSARKAIAAMDGTVPRGGHEALVVKAPKPSHDGGDNHSGFEKYARDAGGRGSDSGGPDSYGNGGIAGRGDAARDTASAPRALQDARDTASAPLALQDGGVDGRPPLPRRGSRAATPADAPPASSAAEGQERSPLPRRGAHTRTSGNAQKSLE